MKNIIVFREGHSGHFLRAIVQENLLDEINFRMPDKYGSELILTHEVNYNRYPIANVVRILPDKNIYNPIYNIFMKKMLLEEFNNILTGWPNNIAFWYDKCFYNIKENYELITSDIAENKYPDVINFDHITDPIYIGEILQKYFKLDLTNHRQLLVNKYKQLQLDITLSVDGNTMEDIITNIPAEMFEQNPWFFSYAIFKYETNNKLTELQRLWSINDIHTPATKEQLIKLATLYNFDNKFK